MQAARAPDASAAVAAMVVRDRAPPRTWREERQAEREARQRVPREVAAFVVHDAASSAWDETVAQFPWQLPTLVSENDPEDGLGQVVGRAIKAATPPHRPSDADMAAATAAGVDDVLADYGLMDMHDGIMAYALSYEMSRSSSDHPWPGTVAGIETAIRDARDKALESFYEATPPLGLRFEEDADGDGDASQGGMSREHRRALFSRLSVAIEDAQPSLRECQYMELYDAARAVHDAL